MIRIHSLLGFLLILVLFAAPGWATVIGITGGDSSGVTGHGTTATPYDSPLIAGDMINIAFFGFTDAASNADLGVATFGLTLDYDQTKLAARQYVTSGFGGGPKSLLSEVAAHDFDHLEQYCWIADLTANGLSPAFPLTAGVDIDAGAGIVKIGGGADVGLKNLGANNHPILIGQVAFDVLADLTSAPTTISVTGIVINPIGGFWPGDELVLLGNSYPVNGGAGEVVVGVPEPTTLLLLAAGGTFLARGRRRGKN